MMSVINQMLKDLEQRAPEQGQAPITIVASQKPSTLTIVFISLLVLLSLNALGFYIWDLQARVDTSNEQQSQYQQQVSSVKLQVEEKIQEPVQDKVQEQAQEKKQSIPVASKEEQVDRVVTLQPNEAQRPNNHAQQDLEKADQVLAMQNTNISEMSVSRRQLTSKELVAQKLARAEKSLNMNEITRAEQLFEEVLIIEPAHKQARKKLAALWFGRKSYQQAANLLAQGISIDRQDGELRLLKARIHLQQRQLDAAYNTLKPLASFENEEYQIMLANIAQQVEQYPSAITAYQVLISMQPYSGRWYLGLAIVYDKNSQFALAVNEYALALTKTDLSASSAKFAQQRLQALGE
ncbi:MAG: tetratricopeptide repeat protein [Colwellia sp.]|nr:tetratricopeptide repeat protein [Colwellia sp.]